MFNEPTNYIKIWSNFSVGSNSINYLFTIEFSLNKLLITFRH